MVWTLDVDDYMATFCNPGTTPLINVLKKGLNLEQVCKMEILVVVSSLVRTPALAAWTVGSVLEWPIARTLT